MSPDRPPRAAVAPRVYPDAPPFDYRAWLESWCEEVVFCRVDASDVIDFVSPSVQSILGYDPEELVGRKVLDVFDPGHPLCGQLWELSNHCLAHQSSDLKRCMSRRRSGVLAFFLLKERDLFDRSGAFVGREMAAQDVTRRVEAELWLRQSERKYRRLIEHFRGDYIIYTRNAGGVITYVSPSIHAVLGIPSDEAIGRHWRDVLGRVAAIRPADIRGRGEDGGDPLRRVTIEAPRRDGSTRALEIQEWPFLGVDGQCAAWEGIAKDVTEARQAELDVIQLKETLERSVALRTEELQRINEDLRASEARYRNVVETQSEFIVRWTPDGRRTFVNEPYCRFLGRPAEELLGASVVPAIYPEDRHLVAEFVAKITPQNPTSTGEARLYAADGSIRWTQWTSQAYFDEAGRPVEYQSVGRDVTELKLAADMLRQKEAHLAHLSRLATMGEMVAGIAHELSQPLHAAKVFAEAARRHLESGRPGGWDNAVDCTREISQAIGRTVEIIRRLREFTKSRPVQLELLNLNEVARQAVEIMTYELRRVAATLQLELAVDLPRIAGDRVQLEQVLVNLLKNACEALESTPADQRRLSVRTSHAKDQVRLEVADSGPGLAGADATRLFEAFYTTKPDGMGMGLSLCKSIAEAHQMQIGFAPNAGQPGMTFYIVLPAPRSDDA